MSVQLNQKNIPEYWLFFKPVKYIALILHLYKDYICNHICILFSWIIHRCVAEMFVLLSQTTALKTKVDSCDQTLTFYPENDQSAPSVIHSPQQLWAAEKCVSIRVTLPAVPLLYRHSWILQFSFVLWTDCKYKFRYKLCIDWHVIDYI